MEQSTKKKLGWGIWLLICAGFYAIFISNIYILSFIFDAGHHQEKPEWEQVSNVPALVFGGGMIDHELMTGDQQSRVDTGVELYHLGRVSHIIMTGDDGARRGNEVDAMKASAIAQGVPEEHVSTDPHGYNTYASCARAANVYGIEEVIVVSQEYHIPRIFYYCSERFGMKTWWIPAPVVDDSLSALLWGRNGREWLARVKAVLEGYLIHTDVSQDI